MRRLIRVGAATVGMIALSHQAMAQSQNHNAHQSHGATIVQGLSEPGQGAFASISEIVALLMADPNTDWASVDITGLRNHLVDMDLLMTESSVTQEDLSTGVRITIQIGGAAGNASRGAASRMVPAHGPVLAAETGWQSDVAVAGDALVWTVTADTPEIVQGLGFYGLMAIGDHHRAHHLSLALGQSMH